MKMWGLSSKVVFWLCETDGKPIIFYEVVLWWWKNHTTQAAGASSKIDLTCGALQHQKWHSMLFYTLHL